MAPDNEPNPNSMSDVTLDVPESDRLRAGLVNYLVREGAIRNPRLQAAFAEIPREFFLPSNVPLSRVYTDDAIVVKWDANHAPSSSSTQPYLMAAMLETLQIQPGMRVLEIGAGVGYNAAIMAHFLGDGALVTSVELDPAMAQIAQQNLRRLAERQPGPGYDRVKVITGDGSAGYLSDAPYDRIVVTVQQWEIAPAWVEQLQVGGLLLLPLTLSPHLWGGMIPAFQKEPAGWLRSVGTTHGSFMPMRGELAHPTTSRTTFTSLPIPQANLYLSTNQTDVPLVLFLKENTSLQATPTGQYRLELTNFQVDPALPPARINGMAYQIFQGFILGLSATGGDQVYTLVMARPQTDEATGVNRAANDDGSHYEPVGLLITQPTEVGYDLALLSNITADPQVRMLTGWSLSVSNGETQPDPDPVANEAIVRVLEIWQTWQTIGQPGFFQWLPLAYPADQLPPRHGYIVPRRFYNLLFPY